MRKTCSQKHHTDKYSQHKSIIWPNGWVFIYELGGCAFESHFSHLSFRFRTCFCKEFFTIQATIECGFILKCVHEMIKTYSQMHRTGKYLWYSSINLLVWLNGWVFVNDLIHCGFESRCSHRTLAFTQGKLHDGLAGVKNDITKVQTELRKIEDDILDSTFVIQNIKELVDIFWWNNVRIDSIRQTASETWGNCKKKVAKTIKNK